MEWISLMGIIASIALFVFLCFKGIRVFISAIVVAAIVIMTSGQGVLETLKGTYMSAFGDFLTKYLFLFILSALFGKAMEASGSVQKLAESLTFLTRKSKYPKFWAVMSLPIFYFLLSYVGISGFTIIFTVLAIGLAMFKEMDIPWMMYPYGGAGIMWAICLGGNLFNTNIIASTGFGTTLYAGMRISIPCFIMFGLVLALCVIWDLRKYEKRNEGFLPSGQPMLDGEVKVERPDGNLPHLIISLLPLLTPVVLLAAFKCDILASMFFAIVLCVVLNIKRIVNIKEMIIVGCSSAIMPIINVCAATAFVSVIKGTSGYTIVLNGLYQLPALASALGLGMVMSAVVASSTSALLPIIEDLTVMYKSAGIAAEAAHRLSTMSVCACMMPHNSGIVNALSLNKLNFAKGSWVYFKTTFFPGVCALLTGVVLVLMGVV